MELTKTLLSCFPHIGFFLLLFLSVSGGKRRRPVSREGRGGESEGTGIPAPLALSMLSHLLEGGKGHALTVAARDAIMADDGTVESLEVRMEFFFMGGGGRGKGWTWLQRCTLYSATTVYRYARSIWLVL